MDLGYNRRSPPPLRKPESFWMAARRLLCIAALNWLNWFWFYGWLWRWLWLFSAVVFLTLLVVQVISINAEVYTDSEMSHPCAENSITWAELESSHGERAWGRVLEVKVVDINDLDVRTENKFRVKRTRPVAP